jgi:hypothetical protein
MAAARSPVAEQSECHLPEAAFAVVIAAEPAVVLGAVLAVVVAAAALAAEVELAAAELAVAVVAAAPCFGER